RAASSTSSPSACHRAETSASAWPSTTAATLHCHPRATWRWSLNGSSSSPEGVRRGGLRGRRLLFAAALVLLASGPVGALDPTRGLAHYIRDDWGAADGYAGGAVYGFAQGADGYLLIAAERGVFRFDGLSFAPILPT